MITILLLLMLSPDILAAELPEPGFSLIDGNRVEDALPDSARDLLGEVHIREDLDFAAALRHLADRARLAAREYVSCSLGGAVRVFAVAVLCSMTAALTDRLQRAISIAGTLALMLITAGDMNSLLGLGRTTITEIAAFGKILMPVLSAASAASGNMTASGAIYVAVMFAIDLLLVLMADLMMPLVWAYLALVTAGGITGNEGLSKLARTLKNGITGTLKLVLGLFVGYLMVGGVISGTADAMTVKTVKLAVSSMIPVAGGVIADAAEAVVAGAGIVRSVIGVFGILGILAMVLLPFLRLLIQYLAFRLSALLSAVAGAEGLDRILEGLGDAFSMVLALTGTSAALLLIGVFAAAAGVSL